MAEVAEDLSGLTRDELNERAEEAGVEAPEDLGSKAEVIAAIEDAEGGDEEEGDEEEAEPEAPEGDIANIPDEEIEGETPAPIQPDSGVILGDTDNVPEELQGHPALVINVKNPDPWADEDEEPVFTVRTRDEHNSTLLLERDDFAEVFPGGVGNRAFGP